MAAAITGPAAPLALVDITKRFGAHRVLDGLTLDVARGEVVALLGANGAGKTTTLNLILGFVAPDAGTIRVDGASVAADPVAGRARLAYLPEQVALYPHLSGTENLRYFAGLAGLRLSAARCAELLAEAGLAPDAHGQRAARYSKGMRQKVGIAIALARDAPLLLLDEPSSGLDPLASADLSRLVRRVAARGTAVLVVTHDLFGMRDMADRLVVLEGGRIGRSLPPAEIDAAMIATIYGGGQPA